MEPVVDLEEAVGSYLNCLSTSCAAGSKLYTSVGIIIDEKFHEIFIDEEETHEKYLKTSFQLLQTQNAFEGYQQALLDCKEKLLEILIESHTKKFQPSKDSKRHNSIEDEQYAAMALRVAKELYCYHQTVADVLKPLVFSEFQEDFENVTLTGVEGKDEIVAAWVTVSEANRPLRQGYGLTNQEIGQILSWQHGEDVSESCRKKLNLRIDNLIQQYIDRVFCNAVCEVDIPTSFNVYPEELQKVLQNCCSPAESFAAGSQGIPSLKEDIEVMLHRELPRVCLCLNGKTFEKASPGKAFENTTLKMRAVRDLILGTVHSRQIEATKEQIDLFCLRILAASGYSTSSASSRTAVLLAFGKYNLVQAKPLLSTDKDKIVYLDIKDGMIEIDVPSKWCIVEDTSLFKSLCRDKTLQPILAADVSYHALINVEEYLVKRIEPVPVARITQCVLCQAPSNQAKKEQGRERSKSIKVRLTKATTKLFQRKSVAKSESEADIIANEYANEFDDEKERKSSAYYSSTDSQDEDQPVPPPRHKRKAKKSKKPKSENPKEKKEDLGWYSSSPKFGLPPVPKLLSGAKDQSPSIASFEELQGVIDFLSGSSSSNLAINEKGDKKRPVTKSHKRNNSMSNLSSDTKNSKVAGDGKLKLCHKKSASFSGKTIEMTAKNDESVKKIEPLNPPVKDELKKKTEKDKEEETMSNVNSNPSSESEVKKSESPDSATFILNAERTPGDGMDNKINKTTSSVNISTSPLNPLSNPTTVTMSEDKEEPISTILDLNKKEDEKTLALNSPTKELCEAMITPVTKDFQQSFLSAESKSFTLPTGVKGLSSTRLPLDNPKGSVLTVPSSQLHAAHSLMVVNPPLLPKDQVNVEVTRSEPVALNHLGHAANVSNLVTADTEQPNYVIPPSTLSMSRRSTPPTDKQVVDAFSNHSSSNLSQHDLVQQLKQQQKKIELHQQKQQMEIQQQLKQPIQQSFSNSSMEQTLYEPFGIQSSWPVGLGKSKLGNLWSDATLENEKPVATSEKISTNVKESKPVECEFTLDKQQDFQKLLEGSRFFSGYGSVNENWKDRSYIPNNRGIFEQQESNFQMPFEKPSTDPWPLSQSSTMPKRNFPPFPSNSNQFVPNLNPDARSGIESLQLPQNPVGPYMRQNREQLLAKQQILEQYARQQKQIQLQQQAQRENEVRMSSNHVNLERMSSMPTGVGLSDRMSSMSPSVSMTDRMSALPSGVGLNNRMNNNRCDILPDRPSFHRPLNPQRSLSQQMPFGGGLAGMQSRSVNDVRMESANLLQDRMQFPQMSEQNIFQEKFNHNNDMFISSHY